MDNFIVHLKNIIYYSDINDNSKKIINSENEFISDINLTAIGKFASSGDDLDKFIANFNSNIKYYGSDLLLNKIDITDIILCPPGIFTHTDVKVCMLIFEKNSGGTKAIKFSKFLFDSNEEIFKCKTLELPDLDNKSRVSCIPYGEYDGIKINGSNNILYTHISI